MPALPDVNLDALLHFDLSKLAFAMLVAAFITVVLAIKKGPGWYWLTGVFMYLFSYLAGFSIGLYTLSFTFVFWALGFVYSLRLVKRFWHADLAVIIGLAGWYLCIIYVDDYFLFRPISWLFDLFFGG